MTLHNHVAQCLACGRDPQTAGHEDPGRVSTPSHTSSHGPAGPLGAWGTRTATGLMGGGRREFTWRSCSASPFPTQIHNTNSPSFFAIVPQSVPIMSQSRSSNAIKINMIYIFERHGKSHSAIPVCGMLRCPLVAWRRSLKCWWRAQGMRQFWAVPCWSRGPCERGTGLGLETGARGDTAHITREKTTHWHTHWHTQSPYRQYSALYEGTLHIHLETNKN